MLVWARLWRKQGTEYIIVILVHAPSFNISALQFNLSSLHFCCPQKLYKRSLSQYIVDIDVNDQRMAGYVGYNQMAWDFGLPQGQFDNITAVQELVSIPPGFSTELLHR